MLDENDSFPEAHDWTCECEDCTAALRASGYHDSDCDCDQCSESRHRAEMTHAAQATLLKTFITDLRSMHLDLEGYDGHQGDEWSKQFGQLADFIEQGVDLPLFIELTLSGVVRHALNSLSQDGIVKWAFPEFSVTRLADVQESEPILPFGKYKGRTLSETPAKYLDWLASRLDDTWLKRRIVEYLDTPAISARLRRSQ